MRSWISRSFSFLVNSSWTESLASWTRVCFSRLKSCSVCWSLVVEKGERNQSGECTRFGSSYENKMDDDADGRNILAAQIKANDCKAFNGSVGFCHNIAMALLHEAQTPCKAMDSPYVSPPIIHNF